MDSEEGMTITHEQKFDRFFNWENHDPHSILGLHDYIGGQKIIRLWRPDAENVYIEIFGKMVQVARSDNAGLFEHLVPAETTVQNYRIYHQNGMLAHDPYAFLPTIGAVDQYLFGKGVHYEIFRVLGSRVMTHQGIEGVRFAVWAPGAKSVSLVADFNYFDGRVNPMRSLGNSGIWELFIPGLGEGQKYKYEIKTQNGSICIKSDPYGNFSELRPATASIVYNVEKFHWTDIDWIEKRGREKDRPQPMNIYEVHLGSWKKRGPDFLNYRELAKELAIYCNEIGYTHIELLPIQEHPLDESWGYQVTGYYAVTSRYGTPEDFQWFVNHLHAHNIGIILDWVPGHFPTDDFSLGRFDGTALYEHADPRQGFHPHWNTYIFNFGRHEISNFLIGNALFWFEIMHIDGLRVDAVASMLYLDYGRDEGQWIPNRYGGKENLEAIEFFRHLNSIVHQRFQGIKMVAEESTSFKGVTHALADDGLGFDLKWNMGWMNDTLRYFSIDMIFRHYHHNDLTFGLLYAFSERFALVLSHDEVVHGKNSLIGKMPGDLWQKFANLRLLLSYLICQPGKKLLFMGGEIGQWNEWYCKAEIEWFLLHYPTHAGVHLMVKEINHLYLSKGCFWERDFDYTGFEWVDFADTHNSVISYLRKGSWDRVLCVHNFTPTYHANYMIRTNGIESANEIFNSDAKKYGGSGKVNDQPEIVRDAAGKAYALKIQLAPLATMIFQV